MYNISLSHFLVNVFHKKFASLKRKYDVKVFRSSDNYTCRFDLSGAEIDYLYIGILPLGCLDVSY